MALGLPQLAQAARAPGPDGSETLRGADGRSVQRERDVAFRGASVHSVPRLGTATAAGTATTARARGATVASLRADLGRSWIAWDEVTALPQRVVLEGTPAPGVMASETTAATFATSLLGRHLGTLAPGARLDDFVLVTNDLSAGIRSVGFVQHHGGVPVVGGQISFRFKNDRLVVIANDALPNVEVEHRTLAPAKAERAAHEWLARDVPGTRRSVAVVPETVVLPLFVDGAITYREVVRVEVDVDAPRTRWSVYVDSRTGAPVARRQDLHFVTSGLVYRVPQRSPQDARANYGAPFADIVVDGVPLVTDGAGVFEFTTSPGTVSNTPTGPFVAVTNADGEGGGFAFVASPGSGTVWQAEGDEIVESQLSTFIHASLVKAHVRNLAPDLAWLDQPLPVVTNIDDSCNAFSDGNSINFYRSSVACENTGLLADVVYHEFGHSVHFQSLLPGVGFFDVALSEGISDYLSATIVDDAGVARGFFFDQTPLRDIDPEGFEYRWPEDRGPVHDEGRIIGGALWDLRTLMVGKYGAAGVFATDRIWYESTRRAVDIPSMYVEALLVDDDDGNLANGTPNVCEINAAYGPHGLFSAGEAAESVLATAQPDGIVVELQLALPDFPQCPVGASPTLSWGLRGEPDENLFSMTEEAGGWSATIPAQAPGSVVQYQVSVNYDNGTLRSLPDNFVDPWYEMYVGDVVPLYCTGFADGAPDWGLPGGWEVGAPSGTSGNRDPAASYDSDGFVLGNGLSAGGGLYPPNAFAMATSPTVPTAGYANVRIQYRRWLTVEDGFFDQAEIFADGTPVWSQFASGDDSGATFHHVDREWRFHDVDISSQAADGEVTVEFSLTSDGGLEFGGWTIDEFCIVATGDASPPCGNGVLDVGEDCEDGNVAAGDGCDGSCRLEDVPGEADGGGEDDSGESDGEDGGAGLDGGRGLVSRGCGCDVDERGAPWMLIAAIGLVLRRRRARAGRRAG